VRAAVLALALVLSTATAALAEAPADTPTEGGASVERAPVTRNAVLAYPAAFFRRGFAFAYERAFPEARLSVLTRLAYDRQAGGDFRSNALGLSVEGRWYFLGRGPFTRYAGRAPLGPYLGLRFGWMDTRLRDANQDFIGDAHRISWELGFGFRMVIASWVDLTPFVVGAVHQDVLAGVATKGRPTTGFGLALGVLFDRDARRARAPGGAW
jgi:hypothetical protein